MLPPQISPVNLYQAMSGGATLGRFAVPRALEVGRYLIRSGSAVSHHEPPEEGKYGRTCERAGSDARTVQSQANPAIPARSGPRHRGHGAAEYRPLDRQLAQ